MMHLVASASLPKTFHGTFHYHASRQTHVWWIYNKYTSLSLYIKMQYANTHWATHSAPTLAIFSDFFSTSKNRTAAPVMSKEHKITLVVKGDCPGGCWSDQDRGVKKPWVPWEGCHHRFWACSLPGVKKVPLPSWCFGGYGPSAWCYWLFWEIFAHTHTHSWVAKHALFCVWEGLMNPLFLC